MKSKLFPLFRVSSIALAAAFSLGTACASPISWDGSDSTVWALGTNWVGDQAPANDLAQDIALFNLASYTTPVFAPNAGTTSVNGVQIGDGATTTGALTLSGVALTVGTSGIDMRANAGVATISSPITLGAAQTWQNASTNLLTLSGAVTGGSNLLTIGGAGNTTISGAIGGTGGLAKSGAGTLTLSSTSNAFSGGVSVSGGTLAIGVATNLPSGNALTLSGGGALTVSGSAVTLANNVTVASGQSGIIKASGSGYAILTGNYSNVAGSLELDIGNGGRIDINSATGPAVGSIVKVSDQATTGTHYMAMNNANAPTFYTNAKVTFNDTGAGDTQIYLGNNGGAKNYKFGALDGGASSTQFTSDNIANTLTITGAADGNYAGIINNGSAGSITLVKTGSSTQILSGANLYTGTTTISGGTLEIGGSGKLGNASNVYAGAITNNAALVYSSSSAQTLSGVISGTGTLTKSGNSTLTLTNIDTYSGNTTINGGTLVLSGSGKLANSPVIDVAANATLQGGVFGTGQTVRGTGTLAGTVTIGANAALSPAGDAAIGTMPVTGTLSLGGTVSMQIQKIGGVVSGDQFTGAGSVAYGGALVVTATGESFTVGDSIQLFANTGGRNNSFTSITLPALPAGLSWYSGGLGGTGTITVSNSLSTPSFSRADGAYAGSQLITITSDPGTTIYYTMDGNVPNGSSPNAASPVIDLVLPMDTTTTIKAFARKSGFADTPVATATYTTYSTAHWNVDSNGDWSGASNWLNNAIPDGPGALVDLFSFAQSASTTVTLDGNRTVGAITFGNANPIDWTVDASNGAVLTLAGSSTPVIAVNGIDMAATISAPLAGGQGLTKSGAGKLTLAGTNTYTGATTINGGTLAIGAVANLPSGSVLTLSGGSTLNLTAGVTLANNITIASGQAGILKQSGLFNSTLTGNYSGVAGTFVLDVSGGSNTGISPNSANGPALGSVVNIIGASGANQVYCNPNNIAAQTFFANAKVSVTATGSGTTHFFLGNISSGRNVQFGALDGGNATTLIDSDNVSTTLTVNGVADGNFAGVVANGSGGTISLAKTGSATQTLSGASTYSGNTTVNAGKLVVANSTGSATGTGAVTVKSAATLAGTGSIGGATTIESGGVVAPGVSGIGTLTVASANMSGTYQCDLGAATSDLIAVTGTLTVGGTTSITFSGTPTANSYAIASYGTLSGTLPAITAPSGYSLIDDSANKQIKLVKAGGYDSWMAAWVAAGFTGNTAAGADPDGNGMKNLLKFVLNGNPGSSDTTILPVQQVTATEFVFSFTRRVDSATGTTQVFEYGSNLAGWTPVNITGTPGAEVVIGAPTGTAPNEVQTVTVTIPRSVAVNGALFGRLHVTQP